jgi:transcriptional regulator with XRE-family HTH domain
MTNPIRALRKKNGMTVDVFAERCKIHPQALYLNECGVYPHILPAVRGYLLSLGYDLQVLDHEYALYQRQKRIEYGQEVGAEEQELGPPSVVKHPFVEFRIGIKMSRMGFSKSFCVHPAFLYKLEHGEAYGLSIQLKEALTLAGFPVGLVNELDYRSREFAEYRASRQNEEVSIIRAAS